MHLFLKYGTKEENQMYSSFNYGTNKEKLMYSFLNYGTNEEKLMYSFLNYQDFTLLAGMPAWLCGDVDASVPSTGFVASACTAVAPASRLDGRTGPEPSVTAKGALLHAVSAASLL
jgi:hypothetical protein